MFRAVVKFSVSSKNVLDALTCKSSRKSLYRYPLSCLDHCFSYNSYPLISPNLGDSKFADPTETFWPLLHIPFFPFSSTFYLRHAPSCCLYLCHVHFLLHGILSMLQSTTPTSALFPFFTTNSSPTFQTPFIAAITRRYAQYKSIPRTCCCTLFSCTRNMRLF